MPATNDLQLNECITLAKEYDPELKRTLGVVTKIDLSNQFEGDVVERLGTFKFPLGLIPVRNRTGTEQRNGML